MAGLLGGKKQNLGLSQKRKDKIAANSLVKKTKFERKIAAGDKKALARQALAAGPRQSPSQNRLASIRNRVR